MIEAVNQRLESLRSAKREELLRQRLTKVGGRKSQTANRKLQVAHPARRCVAAHEHTQCGRHIGGLSNGNFTRHHGDIVHRRRRSRRLGSSAPTLDERVNAFGSFEDRVRVASAKPERVNGGAARAVASLPCCGHAVEGELAVRDLRQWRKAGDLGRRRKR